MSIREERRRAAIAAMAAHLLATGMAGASLRPMAAAAGISDRMLLYYFADKDEVLTATLHQVALDLAARLDAVVAPGTRSAPAVLLDQAWTALRSSALRPYMLLWLDLAAGAGRGLEPHRSVAGAIAHGFHGWIEGHLDLPEAERSGEAARILAAIEGLLVLDAVGRPDLADAARRPGGV